MLLVDVSGGANLIHEFSSRGPEGVERLTQALNVHLGWLVATIQAHGGTVEKFTGDALLGLHVGIAGRALTAVSEHAHATRNITVSVR